MGFFGIDLGPLAVGARLAQFPGGVLPTLNLVRFASRQKSENKTAVVTGGSTGIGLGIARQLTMQGAKVFITGRRQSELDAAVKMLGAQAIGVRSDVSRLDELDHLYDVVRAQASHLDIVVANAGGGEYALMGAISEESFDRTFDINVKGTLFTVQKALPLLRDGSSIILISSTTTVRPLPGFSVYGATKSAIRSFARHWIVDLKDRNIRVNALSPGPTDTPGLRGIASNDARVAAVGRAAQGASADGTARQS